MLGNLKRLCHQVKMYRNILPEQGESRDCFSLSFMHRDWRCNAHPIGPPVAPCKAFGNKFMTVSSLHIFGIKKAVLCKTTLT